MVRVAMVSLWCVLALLTFLSLEASGNNPGVKVRVTQKGLDYERQISIGPLQQKLKTINIPDMSGSDTVLGFIDVSYRVSGMYITYVSLPTSAVGLVPGTGVSLSISNANIDLRGNWNTEYLFVSDDGWFDLSIYGITVSVTISAYNDGTGRPMVNTAYCRASVGGVSVQLHGGLSWLYNLFDDDINSAVRDAIQPKICNMVMEAVNSLNPHLKTLNVLAQVDKYAEIDYSMVGSPFVSYSGVDLGLKGEFYNIGEHEEPPFSPTPFTLPSLESKMMYIGLSAFTLNSAGFVYNNARILKFTVTDSMIPPESLIRLDTKTIGWVIPQIAKQYPGLKVKLLVKAVKEPNIILEPDNMTMEVYSMVSAYAIQPNGMLYPLFDLNVNASVRSLMINVKGVNVVGNLTLDKTDMTLAKSYVGPILQSVKILDNLLGPLLNISLIPAVNTELERGYPLPVIGQMNLVNTQLQILKDYVLIGTDVQFMEWDKRDVPNIENSSFL